MPGRRRHGRRHPEQAKIAEDAGVERHGSRARSRDTRAGGVGSYVRPDMIDKYY